jgi:hypothetical protein
METTHSLRRDMLKAMKDLEAGIITVQEAQAKAKLASQIVYSVRIELEEKRLQLKYNRSVPDCIVTTSIPNIKL